MRNILTLIMLLGCENKNKDNKTLTNRNNVNLYQIMITKTYTHSLENDKITYTQYLFRRPAFSGETYTQKEDCEKRIPNVYDLSKETNKDYAKDRDLTHYYTHDYICLHISYDQYLIKYSADGIKASMPNDCDIDLECDIDCDFKRSGY